VLLAILSGLIVFASTRNWSALGKDDGWHCDIGPPIPSTVTAELLERNRFTVRSGVWPLQYKGGEVGYGVPELTKAGWSDAWPAPIGQGRQDEAFEVRWTSPGGYRWIADAFELATPSDAAEVVRRKTETRCRDAAATRALKTPRRGRELTWTNTFGDGQADIWFARGSRVFRVAQEPIGPTRDRLRVVCRIRAADCRR
jgi:hypothetical protein